MWPIGLMVQQRVQMWQRIHGLGDVDFAAVEALLHVLHNLLQLTEGDGPFCSVWDIAATLLAQ